MQALIGEVIAKLAAEPFGLLGGGLFFFSWVVQFWESKQAQTPTVSARFFWIRITGCVLLAVEGYRLESASLLLLSLGTGVMNGYNIWLVSRRRRPAP